MKSINQKITIITGGNSGIGRATAVVLAREGVRIARIFQQIVKETIPRINAAKPRLLLGLMMSSSMSTVLSFVLTLSTVGFTPNFFSVWAQRLELSLMIGPPVALTLLPFVTKLVGRLARS